MNSAKLTPWVVRAAVALALFLVLFAVAVRPMLPGLASPVHLNVLIHVVILMAALLATLATALGRRLTLRAPLFTACVFAFLAATVVAACLAENRYAAVVRALDLGAWCVLAVVLAQLVSTPARARLVLAALVATLAVLAADGLYQYFVALPAIRAALDEHVRRMVESGALQPSMVPAFVKRANTGDVFGNFTTANGFAACLILLLPASAAAAWALFRDDARGRLSRILGAVLLALVSLAGLAVLVLTRSKGAWLSLAVALGVWGAVAIVARLRRDTVATAAALLFAAFWLAAPAAPPSPAAPRRPEPAERASDNTAAAEPAATPHASLLGASAEVRVEYWKAGWELFKQRPWTGVGPGNFADCYTAFRTPEGSETRHAHNDYLEIAVEQGVPGLAAFLAIWVVWGIALARRAPVAPPDEDAGSRLTFAVVVALAGAAAVAFAATRYVATTETRLMLVAGLALWGFVYAAQARAILRADAQALAKHAPLLRAAVAAGIGALLVHLAIDFDFGEPGITATLAAMLAVGLGLRAFAKEKVPDSGTVPDSVPSAGRFRGLAQAAIVVPIAAGIALVLVAWLYPLLDMSIALEQARQAREDGARMLREAEEWRGRGNLRGAAALRRDADDLLRIEVPKRLDEARRAVPYNADVWMELARIESAGLGTDPRADFARLEALLTRAKTLAPRDPAPYALFAEVLNAQMQSADAARDASLAASLAAAACGEINGAVERYPTQPQLRLLRARLLDRLGRKSEAVEEYRRALDFAERTSEKELKFAPDALREIRLAIRRLENAPGR